MALTVGELNAIFKVDDRTVRPTLRRVEQAMRQTGQQVGDDAERAGREAGEQLGQGLVRGADGQWRDLRGNLVDAVTAATAEAEAQARRGGQQVGQRFEDGVDAGSRDAGDAMADSVRRGAGDATRAAQSAGDDAGEGFMQRMRSSASSGMGNVAGSIRESLASKLALASLGAAAGAALGAALIGGVTEAIDQGRLTGRLQAQLGTTPAVAKHYGKIAGGLFKGAIVDNFEEGTKVVRFAASEGLFPPDATNRQLEAISRKVADVGKTFDVDFGQVAQAAGVAVKTGLAKDSAEALDMIAKGMGGLGVAGEDLLESITEYGVQFAKAGISGRTAFGLMRQAAQAGWKDTDKLADAMKELELRITGGEKAQTDALTSLGLNASKVVDDVSAGGARGEKAMGKVVDAIVKLGPKSNTAKKAIQDLFGGPGEDLGSALFELNMGKAQTAMGDTKGEADKLGEALRGNLGAKITSAKNTMQQNLVDFLNGPVYGALSGAKQRLGGLWDEAGKGGEQGVDRVVSFFGLLGKKLLEKAGELAPKAIEAISGLGQKAADFIMANPVQVLKIAAIAGAIVTGFAALPALIAAAIGATVSLIVISFVGKLITTTVEKLPEWWAAFTGWISEKASQAGTFMATLGTALGLWFAGLWSTYIAGPAGRTWDAFLEGVRGLPSRTIGALALLGVFLAAKASAAWDQFKNAAATKTTAFIGWVAGMPGRISAGIGSLSSLLYDKGVNVVQGLWNGISGMGGWIRDKLIGWAKDMIPGPIAKALGIASPSKVTKAQGKWIARGLVDGLTGSEKQIKAASGRLADIIADGLRPGKKRSAALATVSKGTKQLLKLASQEQKVAARLKVATKSLADQIAARDKLAADVKKGVLEGADITKQQTGGWPQTAETILAQLRQDTAAAQTFARNLAQLRKKGVRSDLIAQIAQAGVTQGSSAAAALANANSQQVKQINAQQAALVTAANQAGATAGSAMYGAGIAAAQGLVRGLQKEQKAIEKQMLAIAKSMSKSIRAALGIKSPSRVMALVGQYTAQGLVKGVESQRSAVNSTMASLVETPAPGSWDTASARARAQASQRVVLELRSSGRSEDDYLMERMRRGIRKKGGGDVDLVLGGRRRG